MQRIVAIITLLFSFTTLCSQEHRYDYSFFVNSPMADDYFFSSVTNDKQSTVRDSRGRIPVSTKTFHSPGNALVLEYVNGEKGQWKATIAAKEVRGQDHFNKAEYLSYWIYNPSAQTTATDFPEVRLMKKDSSLTSASIFGVEDVNKWVHVQIPLNYFSGVSGDNVRDIIGVVFIQQKSDGGQHTLFLDDISLQESKEAPAIKQQPAGLKTTGFARHIDLEWTIPKNRDVKWVKIYRSENGTDFTPVGIQRSFIGRYADYTSVAGKKYFHKITFVNDNFYESPASAIVSSETREMTDDELLTMVQEASFRYYWDGAEPESGLARENIPGRHNMIASGASGFGIMALIAGTERGFITREQSVDRFLRITRFLSKAETFHGAFSHFIDGLTGKVEPFFGNRDNGGDLVETSFLIQGLLAARAYFSNDNAKEKAIRDAITSIWQKVEWKWYRRYPNSKFLYWHWSPDKSWIINHRLIGWNETMVTYLLAIASPTHGVPGYMYYSGWANQDSTGQQYRSGWGGTTEGSKYTNGNTYYGIKLDVGVSNGGPLFFTHYSFLGYDPHAITDKYTNYFTNNQNIALINYRYCQDNPGKYKGYGDSCWGLTASDGPYHYSADEPVLRQDRGKIAPTGAISSFPYTPEESMKALKNYYFNYGHFLWGEYGFRDAFNPTINWCSDIYMGLNQAPMTVMIENYRTGLLWKLFMKDKDVIKGLQKLK